jgi:peptidylprolyl isomerase
MKRILVFFISICAMTFGACAAKDQTEAVSDEPREEVPVNATVKIVDLMEGSGDGAQTGDTVLVNYTGWLYQNGVRGEQFDTSIGKQPFEVIIGETQVIKGWTQGLMGMKIGGKRQLIIPPELAYGATGRPPVIPPSSTLEFEIDLLRMLKAK